MCNKAPGTNCYLHYFVFNLSHYSYTICKLQNLPRNAVAFQWVQQDNFSQSTNCSKYSLSNSYYISVQSVSYLLCPEMLFLSSQFNWINLSPARSIQPNNSDIHVHMVGLPSLPKMSILYTTPVVNNSVY